MRVPNKIYAYVLVLMVSLFVLTGCGGSSGGGEPVAPNKVGYLIDYSPVANMDYECGTKKAKTNSEGKFECSELPVFFKVGNIEVGMLESMTADGKVYPQDLAGVGRDNFTDDNVIKIAVFLQSLDDDGNIATEITLPTEINSTPIDTLSEMTLDEITVFLQSIGKTLVTQEEAIEHSQEPFNMDVTKPVITLNGASTITLTQGTAYTELGAIATDDKDGTVTVTTSGSVDVNTVGTYTITYNAIDGAGNQVTATRKVHVDTVAPVTPPSDTVAPVITISGDNPLEITQGETFSDPGATATDDKDGTISVTPSGTVTMDTEGSYEITYTATDNAGNKATAKRTVIVKAAEVVWNVSTVTEFRQALESAAANGEHDRIVLSSGTYNTTSDGIGTFKFNDNEAFNLTIMAEDGLSPKDVVLDGNKTHQVFHFNNTKSSTLTVKNISVANGKSFKGSGIYSGEIYTGSHIVIDNCLFTSNIANYSGGGFYANSATVTNSIFSSNIANYSGGGFYANSATVTNSTFNSNMASYSGGFYAASSATVTNSTFSSNSVYYSGGGFYADSATVTNSIFSSNSADSGGGFHVAQGSVTVTNSTFNSNSADSGGGFDAFGATKVTNSTFNSNSSGFYADRMSYASDIHYISNNTFVGNSTAICSMGIFINNIFSENTQDIVFNGDSKVYNNYIDYTKINEGSHNVIKKNNLQLSDGDIALADDNVSLMANSVAINKGLNPSSATYKTIIGNDAIYNQMIELLKTDMVGNKRIHNDTIDMGAVEFGSSK